jgi:hypothetical protein
MIRDITGWLAGRRRVRRELPHAAADMARRLGSHVVIGLYLNVLPCLTQSKVTPPRIWTTARASSRIR